MTCGAPLDVRDKVSDSGWREAPRLRDMTEFRFSASTCQVEGELVPVAEITLAPRDGVYFEHHILLWKDESVPLSSMPTNGPRRTILGGMPHIVTVANGPGRIAFSRDAPGELVVLPLHPGMELDVPRARLPARLALHPVLVRPDQGPGEPAARRQRHVHGPVRHRSSTRGC